MDYVTEPWLLEPETIRKLKAMRDDIRTETGQKIHFSNRQGIAEIIMLSIRSGNPQLKQWATDIQNRLAENG
jgi:hypothetical protein